MNIDRQRLKLFNLPYFETINDLSELMHLDSGDLKNLYKNARHYYCKFKIKKRSGGCRTIAQPSNKLKAIQAWILRNILDNLVASHYATAFIIKKGIYENVEPHKNNRYFVCIDIKDFFTSIRDQRVKRLFETIGYRNKVANILTGFCTYGGSLPQGGVTSPSLSNLISVKLDRRLSGLTSRKNIIYTRYADDMTFSSNNRMLLFNMAKIFKKIIEDEKFIINEKKFKVMGPRTQCRITGLIKNSSDNTFGIGKKKKLQMRSVMYQASKNNFFSDYCNINSIEGWLSYLKDVDENSYEQMSRYWKRLQEKKAAISRTEAYPHHKTITNT